MLIIDLILLFIIEDVICCLFELCFDAEKVIILFYELWFFFRELMAKKIVLERVL